MSQARTLRAALLAASALSPALALAQDVGTAGAVNPATTGTPPASATRTLQLGSRVVFRERVNTTGSGNAQLIFLDKTTMSIGPNSQVVIDEFVYDPNAGTGRLTASMAKGVLRYVGGNISHSGGAQIRTPAATLGIRGGAATVQVACTGPQAASCATKVTNHFGQVTVTSAAGTEVIRRAGFTVTVAAAGAAPSSPSRVAQAEVDGANQSLTSRPGQTGGGRASADAVARANVASPVIAGIVPGTAAVQSQNQARQQTVSTQLALSRSPTDAQTVTQLQVRAAAVNQQVTAQNSERAAGDSMAENPIGPPVQPVDPVVPVTPVDPVTPVTPVTPPTAAVPARAFALAGDIAPSLNSPAPFLPGAFTSPGTYANSPVLGYGTGGTNPDGTQNTTRRVLQGGLTINGRGAAQTSTVYVFAGLTQVSNNQNILAGGFTGTTRLASTQSVGRASGGLVAVGGAVTLDRDFVPTAVTASPGSIENGQVTPQTATFFRGDGSPAESYTFTQSASAIPTPAGLGTNRPTATLSGFAAGVGRSVDRTNPSAPAVIGQNYPIEATVRFDLDAGSSRFGSTITATNVGTAAPNALQNASLPFGYQGDATTSERGTYVDYSNFGARESRNTGSGGLNNGGFPATVNGAAVGEHRGLFVTSQTVSAASFFPEVSFCQCEFTRWGFWSSETDRTSGGRTVQDLVHLGTWVAGQPISASEMPRTGNATYNGHVIANIQNGSSQYVAAGNLRNTVNFGTGTGTASVTGLDGRNYAGTLTAPSGTTSVVGTLPVTGGPTGASGSLDLIGQFYRGTAGPAGEMAGGVRVLGGSTYFGRGIFAASTPGIGP